MIHGWFAWIPARLTAVGYATAGNFDEAFAALRRAWLDADGVLVLRDQHLSPEHHIAFSRRFGALEKHVLATYLLPGHPEIYRVSNKVKDGKPEGRSNAGTYWHSDLSYMRPAAMASLLYAVEIPATGGDTMFASMYAAYEALLPGMRAMLGGLRAVHSGARAFGPKATYNNEGRDAKFKLSEIALEEVEHPVICTHAGSGRKYLYVNGGFTVRFADMTEAESKPLLDYLTQHAAKPEFTCRFNWRPGAMTFWANLCTQHFAINDYDGQRRLMPADLLLVKHSHVTCHPPRRFDLRQWNLRSRRALGS